MGAWERTQRRAVGVFWAALAFSCLFLPLRVVSEHFFAAPGFSSHLVNLRPSKNEEGRVGGCQRGNETDVDQ